MNTVRMSTEEKGWSEALSAEDEEEWPAAATSTRSGEQETPRTPPAEEQGKSRPETREAGVKPERGIHLAEWQISEEESPGKFLKLTAACGAILESKTEEAAGHEPPGGELGRVNCPECRESTWFQGLRDQEKEKFATSAGSYGRGYRAATRDLQRMQKETTQARAAGPEPHGDDGRPATARTQPIREGHPADTRRPEPRWKNEAESPPDDHEDHPVQGWDNQQGTPSNAAGQTPAGRPTQGQGDRRIAPETQHGGPGDQAAPQRGRPGNGPHTDQQQGPRPAGRQTQGGRPADGMQHDLRQGPVNRPPGKRDTPPPNPLEQQWTSTVKSLAKVSGDKYNLGALLRDCKTRNIRFEDDVLVIPFSNEGNLKRLQEELAQPATEESLTAAIASAFGEKTPFRLCLQDPKG